MHHSFLSFHFLPASEKSFPGGTVVKNSPANVGDMGSALGLERSPGEGNDNLLQYSCLGNSIDRAARWATVHGAAKESDTTLATKNKNKLLKFVKIH